MSSIRGNLSLRESSDFVLALLCAGDGNQSINTIITFDYVYLETK